MTDLSTLKKAAIDAEAAWQERRAIVLKRLQPGQALLDCTYCARAIVVPDRKGGLFFCPCSPRVGQKVIRPAA